MMIDDVEKSVEDGEAFRYVLQSESVREKAEKAAAERREEGEQEKLKKNRCMMR
jgi:hypothetical protein